MENLTSYTHGDVKELLICQSLLWNYFFFCLYSFYNLPWCGCSIFCYLWNRGNNLCWLKDYKLQNCQCLGKTVLILKTNPSSTTNNNNFNNLYKNYRKRSGSHLLGCPYNFKEKGITYWYLHNSKLVCIRVCVGHFVGHGDYFFLGTTSLCGKWYIHV